MAAAWLLAALAIGPLLADSSSTPGAPNYTPDSLSNTASNTNGPFAPNAFLSIYGADLSYVTVAIGPDDIDAGMLPTALIGAGVRVLINQILADLYYVSPGQVNVLIPSTLIAGPAVVQLVNDGLAGPPVNITLSATAPALFESSSQSGLQSSAQVVIATHGNGPLVTAASPAQPGEVVVLYAAGLGPTAPPGIPNQLATQAAPLADLANFQVLLNGTAVDPHRILYAGVTPGFAGLFQINLQLPANTQANPQVQIGFTNALSPAGPILPVE
jgi:uncharacterized protein (TIGR03437 family)